MSVSKLAVSVDIDSWLYVIVQILWYNKQTVFHIVNNSWFLCLFKVFAWIEIEIVKTVTIDLRCMRMVFKWWSWCACAILPMDSSLSNLDIGLIKTCKRIKSSGYIHIVLWNWYWCHVSLVTLSVLLIWNQYDTRQISSQNAGENGEIGWVACTLPILQIKE